MLLDRHAFAGAARIPNEDRAVMLQRRPEHVHQFVLVFRRHQRGVRNAAPVGDVEQAVVRRAVVGRQSGAVHAENHVEVLQRHVVEDAIVGALQERRVNRADRMVAHRRHARREDDRVFLGNADVEVTVGLGLVELAEARCRWASRR